MTGSRCFLSVCVVVPEVPRNRRSHWEGQGDLLHQWSHPGLQEVFGPQRQPPGRGGLDDGHKDEEPRRGADIQYLCGKSWER